MVLKIKYKKALITSASRGLGLLILHALVIFAKEAVFLSSQEASFITGKFRTIDGGSSCVEQWSLLEKFAKSSETAT